MPPLSVTYIITIITTIVGVVATQNLIDNRTAQLIAGLATVVVPVLLAVAHSVFHANVVAAKIRVGQPVKKADVA